MSTTESWAELVNKYMRQDRSANQCFYDIMSRYSVLTSMINDCFVSLNLFIFLLKVLDSDGVDGGNAMEVLEVVVARSQCGHWRSYTLQHTGVMSCVLWNSHTEPLQLLFIIYCFFGSFYCCQLSIFYRYCRDWLDYWSQSQLYNQTQTTQQDRRKIFSKLRPVITFFYESFIEQDPLSFWRFSSTMFCVYVKWYDFNFVEFLELQQ